MEDVFLFLVFSGYISIAVHFLSARILGLVSLCLTLYPSFFRTTLIRLPFGPYLRFLSHG